ncbi:MAG: methionyl aminopeptidase [Desulfobacterales bacterium]|nr:methionyl aminopeptidase [Desulfobacterales bacterium]MBS3755387.1 methionyl aminopeptidase [Desulfobacterales bacterium]
MKNGTKIGRNDPCPCGSGKKYKKCCMGRQTEKPVDLRKWYKQKYNIRLKESKDIEGIREAGRLVLESLDRVEAEIRPGITTEDINSVVFEHAERYGAVPAPLNYRGFPKSVCTSVNEVICHGIPGEYELKDGDIINVDVTHIYHGYYADASKTFFVGTPGADAQKIVRVAAESLKAAISMLAPDHTIGDIGWAIQSCAERQGCSVVREFVGHGVGFEFHEPPQVPHYGKKGEGIALVPGMVFTVEPMINLGTPRLFVQDDGWTALTADRKLSAQFEQTFLITEDGYESLTPYPL